MKKLFIFILLITGFIGKAQGTTPSYKTITLTKPVLGTLNDSVVVRNQATGGTLKILPVSQIKGTTNLDILASPTGITIFSSTGNDAVLPLVTTTNAGLISPTDKVKLNGIASGATANQTDTYLLDRTNHVGTQAISTVSGLQTELNLKIPLSEKGATNGVATLGSDGKVSNSQIPALAISETFPVSSQAAMLGLSSAEQGDVAIRTDIRKSFVLTQSPASTLDNWQELLTPTDAVQSVNGWTGNVNLTTANITDSSGKRYQTDNQKLFNDATSSIQTQINGKQNNLVSGTNIKTIEGQSLLGSGNIDLVKADVGLSNVDNTSDVNKPISTATQTALDSKAPVSGSASYIQNQAITPQSANMWISGVGVFNKTVNTQSGTSGTLDYGFTLHKSNQADNNGSAIGMLFSLEGSSSIFGKGAIAFERTGGFSRGTLHFLNNNVADGSIPTLADSKLSITAAGAATFASTVTAPTFIGSLTGTAMHATYWGGRPADLTAIQAEFDCVLTRGADEITRLTPLPQFKSWLGLGSNAYSSTDYLPLTGGTLSGSLTATSFIIPKGAMYQSSVGTNALTGNRTVSFPDASGTVALISQTVTNGVITSSPSQDAVYDFVTANAGTSGTSGTYTPTLANGLNVGFSNFEPCVYTKIGNIVTVTVTLIAGVTAANSPARLSISLPFNRSTSGNAIVCGSGSVIQESSNTYSSAFFKLQSNTTFVTLYFYPVTSGPYSLTGTFSYSI